MKRFIAIFCVLTFLTFTGFVSAENTAKQPDRDVCMTYGVIKDINGNMITVVGEGFVKEIILLTNEETYFLNGEYGNKIDSKELSTGMAVMTYYGPIMTKSLPPQSKARAIITGNSSETAKYIKVKKVDFVENGVRVLNSNSDQYITITNDILPYARQQIKEGSELLAWYKVSALSMPGQSTALKAALISHKKADIIVHLSAGVIAVNNKEIQLNPNAPKFSDTMMLPLASISEELGYEVSWDAEKRMVQLKKDRMLISAFIGSSGYARSRANIELDYAPQIIDDRTYVPVEFFTRVLNNTVNIINGSV
ncbi:copper amine oxidase N-terminal domain-containing protein [Selenomonadales bacterium OttesenSCG-928-I06]|nr:copper amine oxidase N-terminal domain-containing protein [Selenomonadales bacterium OttesenSCG-928-I06]